MLPCAFPARSRFPTCSCFLACSLFPMLPCAFPTGKCFPACSCFPIALRIGTSAGSCFPMLPQQLPRSGNLFRTDFRFGPSAPIAYATSVSPPDEAVAWPGTQVLDGTWCCRLSVVHFR